MSERGNASRYDYLYRRIRHDIAHGNILPDEKLPSKRALARNLGVSVITVEAAYAQLIAEGYVRAEERRGYFACELSPVARGGRREGARLRGDAGRAGAPEGNLTTPALSSASAATASAATTFFPYQTWARVMRRTLTEESSATLAEAALGAGSPRLRQAIAAYLREYRGMDVPAERIVVAAGSQTLYQLIIQLLGRDRGFATESPGYPLLERMYEAQGVHCASIPLAAGGIDVAALRGSGASVAHVMPAHQFPTGVVMSAAHRRDLLNWSRADEAAFAGAKGGEHCGRFIVEDDYDAEFRMSGRPIAPLASVDVAGRVIYLNSFTKSLGAAFRIAYMVLPEDLAAQFELNLGFYSNTVSPLEQLALARFIEKGHYERHVNRLRTHAKRTQDAVVEKLKTDCASGSLAFTGLDGGFHFSVRLEAKGTLSYADVERDFLRSAHECGVRVSAIDEVGRYLVNYEQAIVQGGLR
ncbi:PLP-dependent aminotransferase family protein [uncultured Ellagibacter sp.]|uniref:MocR-like pyridoxine biosynthesis transcription factor PdxR n=1 Tax=uncultured Ellagibacter sp. TaxID=2137580 RepID=UPI0025E13E6A|nr:PLP-dependent aminotransferase family protein [uncultured Ellagibacter sp.]